MIGLRKDEPKRVKKNKLRNVRSKERYTTIMPLDDANIGKETVLAFWASQPFDLNLPNNDDAWGNCRGCHLKHRVKLLMVLLANINALDWWIEMEAWATGKTEKPTGARFRKNGPTYAEMKAYVQNYRSAAEAEVARFKEAERIAKATGDLFEFDGESVDCACTD